MQPGETITPGQTTEPSGETEQKFRYSAEPANPQPSPTPVPPTQSPAQPEAIYEQATLAEWSASEYIDHHKSIEWYAVLVLASVLLGGLLYLVTRDWISVVVVLLAAGMFGISGAKKPRTLTYRITESGVQVAGKLYPYEDIKVFSVVNEGGVSSIQLLPLRRFMPPLSIYYPPDMEEPIFNALANYLPHEENKHDPVDRLMKRLRF